MTKFVGGSRVACVCSLAAAGKACGGDDDSEGALAAGSGGSAGLGGGGSGGANGAGGSAGAEGIACDEPLSACGGACLDLRADPTNCGTCGRSCLGAACVAGACAPEALTSIGESAPYVLADDGTYLDRAMNGGCA